MLVEWHKSDRSGGLRRWSKVIRSEEMGRCRPIGGRFPVTPKVVLQRCAYNCITLFIKWLCLLHFCVIWGCALRFWRNLTGFDGCCYPACFSLVLIAVINWVLIVIDASLLCYTKCAVIWKYRRRCWIAGVGLFLVLFLGCFTVVLIVGTSWLLCSYIASPAC